MSQPLERHQQFGEVGWYSVSEAQRLITQLEHADIRYEIDFSTHRIVQQAPSQAKFGGTFGSGAQVLLSIWSEDRGRFLQIHRELFNV